MLDQKEWSLQLCCALEAVTRFLQVVHDCCKKYLLLTLHFALIRHAWILSLPCSHGMKPFYFFAWNGFGLDWFLKEDWQKLGGTNLLGVEQAGHVRATFLRTVRRFARIMQFRGWVLNEVVSISKYMSWCFTNFGNSTAFGLWNFQEVGPLLKPQLGIAQEIQFFSGSSVHFSGDQLFLLGT